MGDCYDTVEQVLKDYVKKSDIRKIVETMARKREWKTETRVEAAVDWERNYWRKEFEKLLNKEG